MKRTVGEDMLPCSDSTSRETAVAPLGEELTNRGPAIAARETELQSQRESVHRAEQELEDRFTTGQEDLQALDTLDVSQSNELTWVMPPGADLSTPEPERRQRDSGLSITVEDTAPVRSTRSMVLLAIVVARHRDRRAHPKSAPTPVRIAM